jgi:tetraacyldisaccharide 4'-kinase
MTEARIESPSTPRSLWQRFYAMVLRSRRSCYRGRRRQLNCPVISIGNLHWGGGGKTPVTAAVAEHLRDTGHEIVILSRGYKSRGKGVRVVSDGRGPLMGPGLAGDEPVLLAGQLPGVNVVVCPDRYRAGVHALERFQPRPDLMLLDDGFSHVRLARSLELLVFPSSDPFAGGRLAPGGRLREPLSASALADAVLMTGAEPPAGARLAEALRPHGFRGPGFASRTEARPALQSSGEPLAGPARVIAVSGIARPSTFYDLARDQGFEIIARLELGDHHSYPPATLQSMERLWSEHDADAFLTTSKDHVKLLGKTDLPLAELPIAARPEEAFWSWLDSRIAEMLER